MTAMQAYLDRYYCEAAVVARDCGISIAEVERLVADGVVPKPSYTVFDDRIVSAAFGDLPNDGVVPGRYFAPSQCAWIERARDAAAEATFRECMTAALAKANRLIFRLRDAFDDAGKPTSGLDARLDAMWTHFISGVFGLCVAGADSEWVIARKEVLQEKLSELTDSGASVDGLDRDDLSQLIDDYAAAAMPFAPAEYPRSSRKRLVDDLRSKLSVKEAAMAVTGKPIHI